VNWKSGRTVKTSSTETASISGSRNETNPESERPSSQSRDLGHLIL
jgi:hypothetical protein